MSKALCVRVSIGICGALIVTCLAGTCRSESKGELSCAEVDLGSSLLQSATLLTPKTSRPESERTEDGTHEFLLIQTQANSSKLVEKIALAHVARLHNKEGQCLSFIHIPKNAGTSIEDASTSIQTGNNGVHTWGRFNKNLGCLHPSDDFCEIHDRNGGMMASLYKWHMPPSWDSMLLATYKQCTTFCVVRDPLAKLKSEWTYFGGCSKDEDFNAWVVTNLNDTKFRPFLMSGHFLPQAEYVWGNTITAHGEQSERMRYCDRVLRFENLTDEFAELMHEFNLPMSLEHHNPSFHCNPTITAATEQLIKEFYAVDYAMFGY